MAGELILDTGAIVTLLDRTQKRHETFVRRFNEWAIANITTASAHPPL